MRLELELTGRDMLCFVLWSPIGVVCIVPEVGLFDVVSYFLFEPLMLGLRAFVRFRGTVRQWVHIRPTQ